MRNTLSEAAQVVVRGEFSTTAPNGNITITLYRNAGGTAETLTSNLCIKQGTTNFYLWPFSSLTTAPTSYSDYLWTMTNGSDTVSGNSVFGGWPDSVSNLQGANTVTITVKDNQAIPVVIDGVDVQIYNSDNTLFLDSKQTDTNGEAVFLLDDGSYKVRLNKTQVGFTIPESLTVSGVTAQEYTGIPVQIVSGAGAGECEVSIFTSSQRPSTPLATLKGTAQIVNLPVELSGKYYPGQKVDGTYSSIDPARLYWVLPRGATVQFTVSDLGISAQKAIPDQASADYKDL